MEPESTGGRIREFIRKRPVLSAVVTAVVGLLIGGGVGFASRDTEITDLEDQVALLEEDLEEAEEATDEAEQDVADVRAALSPLRDKVAQFEKQKDDLAAQQDELASQAEDLDVREADISAAEQTLEASTIPDGTWELGRDYEAGTYRAEGGGGCYWEKLSSPSGRFGDLIANGGFNPNQTLVIDSPYFHTEDCGEWVKIE